MRRRERVEADDRRYDSGGAHQAEDGRGSLEVARARVRRDEWVEGRRAHEFAGIHQHAQVGLGQIEPSRDDHCMRDDRLGGWGRLHAVDSHLGEHRHRRVELAAARERGAQRVVAHRVGGDTRLTHAAQPAARARDVARARMRVQDSRVRDEVGREPSHQQLLERGLRVLWSVGAGVRRQQGVVRDQVDEAARGARGALGARGAHGAGRREAARGGGRRHGTAARAGGCPRDAVARELGVGGPCADTDAGAAGSPAISTAGNPAISTAGIAASAAGTAGIAASTAGIAAAATAAATAGRGRGGEEAFEEVEDAMGAVGIGGVGVGGEDGVDRHPVRRHAQGHHPSQPHRGALRPRRARQAEDHGGEGVRVKRQRGGRALTGEAQSVEDLFRLFDLPRACEGGEHGVVADAVGRRQPRLAMGHRLHQRAR